MFVIYLRTATRIANLRIAKIRIAKSGSVNRIAKIRIAKIGSVNRIAKKRIADFFGEIKIDRIFSYNSGLVQSGVLKL